MIPTAFIVEINSVKFKNHEKGKFNGNVFRETCLPVNGFVGNTFLFKHPCLP